MATETTQKSRTDAASADGEHRSPSSGRLPARERLLSAANELFYSEGVNTVGIDRIIEHAGVAKASLYNSFRSKEDLVGAYLRLQHDDTTERLTQAINQHHDPRERLLAVFDSQAQLVAEPNFNGCAIVNATTEAHGRLIDQAADEFRVWVRTMFTDLAHQAGAKNPTQLGQQLHLIYDAVALSGRMDHDPSTVTAARAAAEALLDAAIKP
ncbi:MAG TPA: TetR/AcrR family transcriptional regulator [Kribbella sp.]|jgi:AcrR family transcriptional regulator